MTRAWFKNQRDVWAWHCDTCGAVAPERASNQNGLPGFDEMRRRGWFIAPTWGDLCPACAEGDLR